MWGEGNKTIKETPQVAEKRSQPNYSETRRGRTKERLPHKEPPNLVSAPLIAVNMITKQCKCQKIILGRDDIPRRNILIIIFLFREPDGAGRGIDDNHAGNYSFRF